MEQSISGLGRRSLVCGAAWSVPAIAIAAAAPAMAASPCAFDWETGFSIQANCIIRDKHQATGTGDCSDVSVDPWIVRRDNGDGTSTVTPWLRVIVGTQFEARDITVTFTLFPNRAGKNTEFDEATLSGPVSPAQGAIPPIYQQNMVTIASQPSIVDPTHIVWSIASMPAQSSVQFEVAAKSMTMTLTEADQLVVAGVLHVSGTKDCGVKPQQCPAIEPKKTSEAVTCSTGC